MKVIRTFSAVLLSGVILAVSVDAASTDSPASERSYHLDNEFWTHLAKDGAGVLVSPFSWKPIEILGCAAVLGSVGLTYARDGQIQDWAQEQRTPGSDDFMKVMEKGGDAAFLAAFLAGLYLAGELGPSIGLRRTAVLGLESLAVSGAVVLGMKCVFGRARPEMDTPPNHFRPFTFQAGFMSLPSGHAASAFAVATTIARQTDSIAVDVMVYSLAGLVAASRVHDNKHWASDVLLGAALGHVIALKIADFNRPAVPKVSLAAGFAPGGFVLSFRF